MTNESFDDRQNLLKDYNYKMHIQHKQWDDTIQNYERSC